MLTRQTTQHPTNSSQKSLFFDFTIVGAGASGLWLAFALFKQGLLEKNLLCVVENHPTKQNDRTWCYWSDSPLLPINMVSKAWSSIHNPSNRSLREDLSPYTYYYVHGDDFYAKIKQQLKNCANITWLTAVVFGIEEQDDGVLEKTTQSAWLRERVFMSALPPHDEWSKAASTPALHRYLGYRGSDEHSLFLWQPFVGWRIQTTEPVFDDTCATMMRFDIAQQEHTQFIYELPFSATEALVEMTRFSEHQLTLSEAETTLRQYLLKKGIHYRIVEEETGAIHMTPQFDIRRKYLSARTQVVYIGTLGGAIKPTTGYGFKRTQAYRNALAIALEEKKPLPTMHRPWQFRLYDHLLLSILLRQPHRGKSIFERLFETQPTPRLLRFLDEETTIWEEVMIFSRLPIRLFLRSLIHYCLYR